MQAVSPWRAAFRAFLPDLPTEGLEELRDAVRRNDPRLIQGKMVLPDAPPDPDEPIVGACAIGYVAWKGLGLTTVGEVDDQFARWCIQADQNLGEVAGCRYFLNDFDDWPRDVMVRELLPELTAELERREAKAEVIVAGELAAA